MADVSKFVLDSQTINVKDATSRSVAEAAQASVQAVQIEVDNIKALSRLTVSYDEANEAVSLLNTTH